MPKLFTNLQYRKEKEGFFLLSILAEQIHKNILIKPSLQSPLLIEHLVPSEHPPHHVLGPPPEPAPLVRPDVGVEGSAQSPLGPPRGVPPRTDTGQAVRRVVAVLGHDVVTVEHVGSGEGKEGGQEDQEMELWKDEGL